MENLKENSIHIKGKIDVCRPQYFEEDIIDVSDLKASFNNAYSENNGIICFVHNHEVYVTPSTRKARETLEEAGLEKDCFYVPFSNWDYPKNEEEKWSRLCDEAREAMFRDYEFDSGQFCDKRGIGRLSDETMKRCFKIPRGGVLVINLGQVDVTYPLCSEFFVDFVTKERLGRFCSNNGTVCFVYRDGHTYVTEGYWILDELREAGFLESDLPVPFSNGEEIIDSELKDLYETVG